MPFLFLLLLTLVCLPDSWQSLTWDGPARYPVLAAALTWAGVGALVAAAAWLAFHTRRLLREHPEQQGDALDHYRTWRSRHLLAAIAFYGVALFGLGWGWAVQNLGPLDADGRPQMFPGAELLVLAPFLATLVLSWACFYDAERALNDSGPGSDLQPFWGRWAHVGIHVRHNLLLVFVPVGLLILEKALRRTFADWQSDRTFQMAVLALLGLAFLALPWVLRLVLRLRPLPPGPLRDRLLASARRLNFRCSGILLWNTRGAVANAMVVGLVPFIRYVVLTDRLLTDLTPDEVEAVFGHEVGHVKHRHMLYYLGFLLISLAVVAGLWDLATPYVPALQSVLKEDQDLAALPLVAVLGTYIFVVFGFLSRRCERQADLFGCRAVSCARSDCAGHEAGVVLLPGGRGLCSTGIRTFIDALEKVARVNGINRSRPGWMQSWQHSTIARRVEFLQRVLAERSLEARFQRRVVLVKVGLLVGLLALMVLLSRLPGGWEKFWLF